MPSVLVVFVVFCVHMHRFAGLKGRRHHRSSVTLQTSSATLIPLFSSSELTGRGYPGLLDRKNRSDKCPRWESNPRRTACKASTLSTRPGSPLTRRNKLKSHLVLICFVYILEGVVLLGNYCGLKDSSRNH